MLRVISEHPTAGTLPAIPGVADVTLTLVTPPMYHLPVSQPTRSSAMSKSTVHIFYSDHRGVEVKHRVVTPLVAAEVIARASFDGYSEQIVNELTWSLENETSGYTIGTESGGTITAIPESSPHLAKAYGPAASSPFEVIAEGVYDEVTDTVHVACDALNYTLPYSPACPECARSFDLTNEDDAAEYAYGHDCEA